MARPATGCSSLLWQWPTALQLAAMADNALQPWPMLRCSVFVLFFIFFTRQLQERKRERQKEKGRESL
jgi:hypothetical protein